MSETTTALRPETVAFLKDWLAWVERGAPQDEPFSRRDGLCLAAFIQDAGKGRAIYQDLDRAFAWKAHPFGKDYPVREASSTQHECPKRLAWVREQIALATAPNGEI